MQIQIIDNQYDNKLKSFPLKDSYNNLLEIISTPYIISDKNMIPQWKICTVTGDTRKTENMGKTNVLFLDYDSNNFSIKDFELKFSEYKYILHTSHSYNGENNNFRVLLFLDKTYEINSIFDRCVDVSFSPFHILLNYFKYVDQASFIRAQFFKMPAKASEDSPYYYSIHNGKLFSLTSIEGFSLSLFNCRIINENYYKKLDDEHSSKYNPNQDMTAAKNFIYRKLEELKKGERHFGVFGLASWFSSIGGSFSDFYDIERPSWADRNFMKQIEGFKDDWVLIGSRRIF